MPNRLASVKSLYLRKHAENPIDWWYWCDEALAEAKSANKPIFLSIGYSSCHWCTVMEGEAFSDPQIAAYLNENFLPIKVDREERPDIDSVYMQALQMITGQGGWPLNIFLTPEDLIPFYGGTYFPVQPLYGRHGFLDILRSLRHFYDQEKEKLNAIKEQVQAGLQQGTVIPQETENSTSLNRELLNHGLETNTGVISSNSPGSPSFPMIPYADLACRASQLDFDCRYNPEAISRQRGQDLVLGGIFDQVGGGFHRYTVDSNWIVPHFEKMLYDNGLILEYLANLWSQGVTNPELARAVSLTVEWLEREMTSPQGYFYAAQDADSFPTATASEPEEGAFYVWKYTELEEILSQDELRELCREFTITPEGNFEGNNVLQRKSGGKLSNSSETAIDKLFTARYGKSRSMTKSFVPARDNQEARNLTWPGRIPPVTDTKMIVSTNSLMISGLARAYAVFQVEHYWELAIAATQFILEHQWHNHRFYRLNYAGEAMVLAQAEDYAFFIKALLDLHAANPEQTQWLERAKEIQTEFDALFWNEENAGYYNNGNDDSDTLPVRERSYNDNATPSANGVAVANLVRLSLLSDRPEYLKRAESILKAFYTILAKYPQACPSLVTGLYWYLYPICVRTTSEQIKQLQSKYLPNIALSLATDLPPDTVGIVCQGLNCQTPAQTGAELWEQMSSFG